MRKYNKSLFLFVVLCFVSMNVFSQVGVSEPDPSFIGIDTAQQSLREVSVSKFEDAAFWYGSIGADSGILTLRTIEGSPVDKEPLEGEVQAGVIEEDKNVLGSRVDFFKRGITSFTVNPVRPLPIEGITKTVSVWVIGRNTKHVLKLMIKDHFDNYAELTMGELNFSGWKKMVVAIPPHIVQRNYHYNDRMGIQIIGFKVDCNIDETYGKFYLYLDDLRAVTDLFSENNQDQDDIVDAW